MLADMGAEVIKIEPADGETMRNRPPLRNNFSSVFGQLNVGKKSLVLDLKSPQAIEVIRRLVTSADILVENFRPGVMRRLKLDYGSLAQLNPGLIYCSISGYGQTGPSAELPAYGGKMGIDATRKWASEGYNRTWPARIKTTEQVAQKALEIYARFRR